MRHAECTRSISRLPKVRASRACPGVNEKGRDKVSTQNNLALSFLRRQESRSLDPGHSSLYGSEFRDDRRRDGLLNSAKAVAEPRACPGGAMCTRSFSCLLRDQVDSYVSSLFSMRRSIGGSVHLSRLLSVRSVAIMYCSLLSGCHFLLLTSHFLLLSAMR